MTICCTVRMMCFHDTDMSRDIAQAVSRRLPTAVARVQTRVWRWGKFSPRTSVSPANLHSISFSTIIFTITRGWHNRPGVAAVPPHKPNKNKKNDTDIRNKTLKARIYRMYAVTLPSRTHFQVSLLRISLTFRIPLNILQTVDYEAHLFRIMAQIFVLIQTPITKLYAYKTNISLTQAISPLNIHFLQFLR
jgi:hypothetical protein